ncbi:hypothetical protein LCGC14_1964080 [marine sediment metagenome]|uniref:Uncharacterized protein n=1 Tax=marine sediment metagenome TaxID=412755 RepID=A0A0F9HS43_9ZZZZ
MGTVGNYKDRKIGRWDSEDGLKTVSTCSVSDGREPFETAVQHPAYNNGKMVIVECYSTKKDAIKGHNRWLKLVLKSILPNTLVDCQNSKISQMCGTCGCQMSFKREDTT